MPRLPVPHQRAHGRARVGFAQKNGQTRLSDLFQAGAAKAMLPRVHRAVPEVVLVNTAGGLTGGDRMDITLGVGPGARAVAATQTAERIYRSLGPSAQVRTTLRVEAGGHLDWLAQETILFERAALCRKVSLDLCGDATALIVEPIVFGRAAMGENPGELSLRDTWEIRRDGALVHIESLALGGSLEAHRTTAGLGAARAMATVLYVGADAEDRLERARALLPQSHARAAISAWDGRLVLRLLADSAQDLRATLIEFLTGFRGAPLPRVWTM